MKLAVRAVESEGSVVSAKQELLPVSGEMTEYQYNYFNSSSQSRDQESTGSGLSDIKLNLNRRVTDPSNSTIYSDISINTDRLLYHDFVNRSGHQIEWSSSVIIIRTVLISKKKK